MRRKNQRGDPLNVRFFGDVECGPDGFLDSMNDSAGSGLGDADARSFVDNRSFSGGADMHLARQDHKEVLCIVLHAGHECVLGERGGPAVNARNESMLYRKLDFLSGRQHLCLQLVNRGTGCQMIGHSLGLFYAVFDIHGKHIQRKRLNLTDRYLGFPLGLGIEADILKWPGK